MYLYQTAIIIKPDISDDDKRDLINKYVKWLKIDTGGKHVVTEDLGTRSFAADPIIKYKSGNYTLFTHYASGEEGLEKFQELLDDDDLVLKHLTIKLSEEASNDLEAKIASEQLSPDSTDSSIVVDALDVALGLAKY